MTYHYFRPHLGGLEEHVYQLSKRLVERGNRVTVITSNIGLNRYDIRPEFEVIDGIEIIRCKAKPWLFRSLKLIGFKDKLKKVSPDIFHTHHPIPGVSDTTVFFAKSHGFPSIVTYHADSAEDTFLNKTATRIYIHLIGKKMIKVADKVIATTRSYAQTSPLLNSFLDKVVIIPNGVDVERFSSSKGEKVRKKYNLYDKFVIFALGRMVPYKGFSYLIKAMSYLPKKYILILGGTGILRKKLERLTVKYNLENRVIFTGFIPEEEKPEYYAACDVFVLPSVSRGEAFGITLLEAMASGKPVIATDLPGVKEVAGIGGMIVPPKNPKKLAIAIKTMSHKNINSNKLRRLIKKKFSWEKVVDKIVNVYKQVINIQG